MPEIPIQEMMGGAAIIAGLVWALMEAFKKVGLPANAPTAIVAILLGPALAILWTWTNVPDPSWERMVNPGLTGLIGSLAAMGFYKLAQWSPPNEPAEPPK